MTGEMVTAGHLGGYIAGGDEATWYPELWTWLVEEQHVRSVIDVGCGEGHSLRFFRELGCKVWGVDGIEQPDPDIAQHDFTRGPYVPLPRYSGPPLGVNDPLPPEWKEPFPLVDLAWCCEFVEHVEERYVSDFVRTFRLARTVLMTHAFPHQQGHHHVNCQLPLYWKGVMAAAGFRYDDDLTSAARGRAAANESTFNHFVRSGLAFRRYA